MACVKENPMWYRISNFSHECWSLLTRTMRGMDANQWFFVFVAVVVVGFFCMRGKQYR